MIIYQRFFNYFVIGENKVYMFKITLDRHWQSISHIKVQIYQVISDKLIQVNIGEYTSTVTDKICGSQCSSSFKIRCRHSEIKYQPISLYQTYLNHQSVNYQFLNKSVYTQSDQMNLQVVGWYFDRDIILVNQSGSATTSSERIVLWRSKKF